MKRLYRTIPIILFITILLITNCDNSNERDIDRVEIDISSDGNILVYTAQVSNYAIGMT